MTKIAYEILHRSYDWNRYPSALLGCKAVAYEDGATQGSWASRGIDGWYLGPSMDHNRCDIYFIPETCAYQIYGSTELFPQHCQLLDMSPYQHLHPLTDELTEGASMVNQTIMGKHLLQMLHECITTMVAPPPMPEEQRGPIPLIS
jgi:hypothetical protein